jgi:hypothetical protein
VVPILQAQDGSFVGTYYDLDASQDDMIAFDASGNIRWVVPNETPQIATEDGGVIGKSGRRRRQIDNLLTQSWTGRKRLRIGRIDCVNKLSTSSVSTS